MSSSRCLERNQAESSIRRPSCFLSLSQASSQPGNTEYLVPRASCRYAARTPAIVRVRVHHSDQNFTWQIAEGEQYERMAITGLVDVVSKQSLQSVWIPAQDVVTAQV